MTLGGLKALVAGLMIGDNVLSKNENEVLALLDYAYLKIATEADALKLFTASKDNAILRQGAGGMFVRMPKLPKTDEDMLDIDHELGVVAARFICSFISREKGAWHAREASKLIGDYNSKVDQYLTTLGEDAYDTGTKIEE